MEITKLTMLGFDLNHALDSGKHASVSIDEVKAQITAGKIFDFLEERLGSDVDLSWLYGDDRAELLREWRGFVDAVDEERKFGVSQNGLCLLVAYLFQGIQQRRKDIEE